MILVVSDTISELETQLRVKKTFLQHLKAELSVSPRIEKLEEEIRILEWQIEYAKKM